MSKLNVGTENKTPIEHSGKRAAAAIAGSRLVVIKGGPHGINASHADEFNRALIAFVEG